MSPLAHFTARYLAAAMGFSLAINIALLAPSLFMLQVYDRVLVTRSLETLTMLGLLALVTVATYGVLERVRGRLLSMLGMALEQRFGPPLLQQQWQAVARGVQDAVQIDHFKELSSLRAALAGPAVTALFDTPWLPAYLLLIAAFEFRLGLLAGACAAVLLALTWLNGRFVRASLPATQAEARAQQRWLDAAAANAEVVTALGMGPGLAARWLARASTLHERLLSASGRTAALGAATRSFRQAVLVLMMSLGAYLVVHDGFSAGVLIACTVILGRALGPVEQLVAGWSQLTEARLAWQRLDQALRRVEDAAPGLALPRPQGQLAVHQLGYALPGTGRWLLRQVALEVRPGEVLAVLGGSGAGKTTLARLLAGVLPPSSGVVRLDGADIRQLRPELLGPALGYLPQDVELFPGSVADNIARFSTTPGGLDGEAVVGAAQAAGAHELISRLPQGYDTPVGEGGRQLSGGQRQRVALARALYGDPALVVLDEPDASLDAEGEEALIGTLQRLRERGAAVVVVTQRRRLVSAADKLIVLREGMVERVGTRGDAAQGRAAEVAGRARPGAEEQA